MDYCGDCDFWDIEKYDEDKWRPCERGMSVFADHPACRKFKAKKSRTCGDCKEPYWREDVGLCANPLRSNSRVTPISRIGEACEYFRGKSSD